MPTPRPRRRVAVALLVAATAAACRGAPATPTPTPAMDPVLVGTGPEAESELLAAVAVELLAAKDVPASVTRLASADDARQALELGDVDVVPAYTGEVWLSELGRADPPSDQATSLARVAEFDERAGLRWLRPVIAPAGDVTTPPADATFAFVVAAEGPHGDLVTMSQLATRLGQLDEPVLCVDRTFAEREDGLGVVLDVYSVAPETVEVRPVTPRDAVLGVAAAGCVAGLTSATDGAAWGAGQRPLVDDLGVFPAFVVAMVLGEEVQDRDLPVAESLQPLADRLTTAMLGGWNARVLGGEPVPSVAADAAATLLAG